MRDGALWPIYSGAMGSVCVLTQYNYCGDHSYCDHWATRTTQINGCTGLVPEVLCMFRHQLCIERLILWNVENLCLPLKKLIASRQGQKQLNLEAWRKLKIRTVHPDNIVLVPLNLPPTPWASRPNSFAADCDHVSLYFGSRMSCRYFRYSPDALS